MAARTKTEAPADAEATQAEPGAPVDYSAGQAEIEKMITFHGHPVGAQLLREVLGWLGRTAGEAARRRPQNRPADLQGKGWEKSSLLALAELCAAYAPEVGTINAPTEPDMFPDATSPGVAEDGCAVPAPLDPEAQRAEIASHRAQVVRERAAANGGAPTETEVRETEQAVLTLQLGAERLWHSPDPAVDDEYASPVAYSFHRPDPAPDEPSPANADESRSVIGREQGEPPF